MAGPVDATKTSIDFEDVNEILRMASLPPLRSLTNVPLDSDAGVALNIYRNVLRSEAATGWWFNRDYRVKFSPDENGNIAVDNAILAQSSGPLAGEAAPPEVFLEVPSGASGGNLRNLTDDNYVFSDDIYLDLIRPVDYSRLPQVFKDYCVLRAGRRFAASMGLKVDSADEEQAWLRLDKADAEFSETANVLDQNPQTIPTWRR